MYNSLMLLERNTVADITTVGRGAGGQKLSRGRRCIFWKRVCRSCNAACNLSTGIFVVYAANNALFSDWLLAYIPYVSCKAKMKSRTLEGDSVPFSTSALSDLSLHCLSFVW